MIILEYLRGLLFPPKCIFCRKLLPPEQTDLCHSCRKMTPECNVFSVKFFFLAQWCAVWYYKDRVRSSILRYKFGRRRSYAQIYGRQLAMKLQKEGLCDFDLLCWVPTGTLRKLHRGYDQVELIARVVAKELQRDLTPALKKIRNTPPQSRLKDAAHRRANILGAYRVVCPEEVRGKRVLLLDDIITTGATLSECAKVLQFSGAKKVTGAAVAVAPHDKKNKGK